MWTPDRGRRLVIGLRQGSVRGRCGCVSDNKRAAKAGTSNSQRWMKDNRKAKNVLDGDQRNGPRRDGQLARAPILGVREDCEFHTSVCGGPTSTNEGRCRSRCLSSCLPSATTTHARGISSARLPAVPWHANPPHTLSCHVGQHQSPPHSCRIFRSILCRHLHVLSRHCRRGRDPHRAARARTLFQQKRHCEARGHRIQESSPQVQDRRYCCALRRRFSRRVQ